MLLALLMVYLQKDGSCSYPKPSLVKESFPFCEIYLLRKEGALIHFDFKSSLHAPCTRGSTENGHVTWERATSNPITIQR